jgi:ankyrin repeat protein
VYHCSPRLCGTRWPTRRLQISAKVPRIQPSSEINDWQCSHKRSKSVIAKSLLGRGNAKSSLSHDGEEGTEDLSTSGTSPSLMSSPNVPPKKDADSKQSTQEPQSAKAFPPTTTFSVGDTHASIEQSVKKFKVFEVLRNGDKEAIERVLADISAGKNTLEETTILHLAIQCAEPPVVEYVLSSEPKLDINAQDRDGNTPLHFAAMLGRVTLARLLLDQKTADSSILNYQGKSALDTAKTPEVFQLLQLDRALFIDTQVKRIQQLVRDGDYNTLESVLEDSRVTAVIDVNGAELASESATVESGGSLLHEASRKKDMKLIQLLLLNGADPFRRDRRGKLPQDVTKDDKTRAILKKSPAATAAQRGIQEKAILGSNTADKTPGGKESREIKGYLKKWTNYTSGYKLRWFVLEDGVLSYYKHQGMYVLHLY